MRRRHLLAALPAAALAPCLAAAQDWPPGPVRAIVPFAPGSATDTVARVFTEKMRDTLGQNVVVELCILGLRAGNNLGALACALYFEQLVQAIHIHLHGFVGHHQVGFHLSRW